MAQFVHVSSTCLSSQNAIANIWIGDEAAMVGDVMAFRLQVVMLWVMN